MIIVQGRINNIGFKLQVGLYGGRVCSPTQNELRCARYLANASKSVVPSFPQGMRLQKQLYGNVQSFFLHQRFLHMMASFFLEKCLSIKDWIQPVRNKFNIHLVVLNQVQVVSKLSYFLVYPVESLCNVQCTYCVKFRVNYTTHNTHINIFT